MNLSFFCSRSGGGSVGATQIITVRPVWCFQREGGTCGRVVMITFLVNVGKSGSDDF